MATYADPNRRTALGVNMREPFKGDATKTEEDDLQRPSKGTHQLAVNGKTRLSAERRVDDDGAAAGESRERAVSFSTNHNSVVCLPLVSEGLKLVWTQSDQTRELDSIPELVQAFNVFPYPTSREVTALARLCALPLDKVKVWFMVQRIKYGISWASEEIEETRRKLAGPELAGDYAETTEGKTKTKRAEEESPMEAEDSDRAEGGALPPPPPPPPSSSAQVLPRKRTKYETPEPCKPAKTVPCFSSSLPPPEDSYYYRPPADLPGSTAAVDTTTTSPDPSSQSPPPQQQQPRPRHGRYKKSKAQLAVLRGSFLRENWPAEAELRRLQEETGLCRNDIRKWFSDSRYQLRNGRGLVGGGAAQVCPAAAAAGGGGGGGGGAKADAQLLPLPLVANKAPRHEQQHNGSEEKGGAAAARGGRGHALKDSHFFQTFLSNSMEAFGERAAAGGAGAASAEETSVHSDGSEEIDVAGEGKPLQLVTVSREPEIPPPPPQQSPPLPPLPSPSSSPSLSVTPPPAAAAPAAPPPKRLSSSSQKSAPSTKAGSSSSSSLAAAAQAPPPPGAPAPSSSSSSSSPVLTPAGRPRKTKDQLDVLKQHFLRCQWPKSEDYSQLVELTGLPRADVIQWFGDTRYAVKNGQLRWVQGVREQFLAERAAAAAPQNGGGVSNGNGSNGGATPRGGGGGGSRKRRSQATGATAAAPPLAAADLPDLGPLEAYRRLTGALQEKDLDALCKKSRMSYQQVRDWFASQESAATEPNVTD